MSENKASLDKLNEGWDSCKAADDQKNCLINDLFAYIEEQAKRLSDANSDLRDKKDLLKLARDREDEAKKQVQDLQVEKTRHGFASVVIDGDCMPFRDELVQQGLDGGKRAASLLRQAVEEELKLSVPDTAHYLQVSVWVYANVKGLAWAYKEENILPVSHCLDEFIRGFNMGDVMCNYVDAGNGKECADEKVKAMLKFHVADVHCQQILFGGAADNGYARPLQPYLGDDAVRSRITLLEGPPFARELADIKDKFHTAAFQNVFSDHKLSTNVKRRVPSHSNLPASPPVNYASATARAISPSASSAMSNTEPSSTGSTMVVLRNKHEQRVDTLLSYSWLDFDDLKGRKLCNSFHILGKCPFLEKNGYCQHEHGQRVNARQMKAIQAVSRLNPCHRGLACTDPRCILGHRCNRDRCDTLTCRFPQQMHNVDTKVHKFI